MTLNDSLSSCTTYDDVRVRYVRITFWKVANADLFIKNPKLLIEYLESISQYKISKEILAIEDGDSNLLQVRIKCPGISAANIFFKNLQFIAKDLNISVVVDKPSIASRVNDHLEEIQVLYSEMSKKVNEAMDNYVKLITDLDSDKGLMSLNQFEKRLEVKAAYCEKINELNDHKKEFDKSQVFVEKSLKWFRDNSIFSEEEIKKLVNFSKREIFRCESALPIYARKSEIVKTVMNNQVTVLVGETGSGKTTQIAQYLHEAWPRSEKIIACTQPRKVAAVSVADRVSDEMKCNLGDIVGYQVGMSKKTSGNTRILFMTDHILLNECLTDKIFSKYSCIILDEAHERSIFTDLLLGFIKKAIKIRNDLRLVITSATIDPTVFQNYFRYYKPPQLKVSGRVFPVDVIYETPSIPNDHVRSACDLTLDLHHKHEIPGDILVFLTSPSETEQAVKILKSKHAANAQVLQLHGRLQIKEQQEVLKPTKDGLRKIVFATNAAETSVTIPGIKYVVDTGMVREVTFDGSKNMSSLVLTKVTKSSADQRKGRAGRTESGICYRLYSEQEFNEMKPNSVPEILRVHLGQSLLKLMLLGVNDPKEFDFVEAPSVESMNSALEMLTELKAIDDNGITELGKKLALISLEPRLGKMVLMGVERQLGFECVVISALCATGSQIFFRGGQNVDKIKSDKRKALFCDDCGDMATLLNVYKEWVKIRENERSKWCGQNYINSKKINGTKDLIRETLHCLKTEMKLCINESFSDLPDVNLRLSKIIFECYYSNLAKFTGHRQVGFRMVKKPYLKLQIHPSSSLTYVEQYPKWIVFESILTTSETFLLNTTFIKPSWVDEKIQQGSLRYSQEELQKVALERVKLGNLGCHLHKIISLPLDTKQNDSSAANKEFRNYIEERIYNSDSLSLVDIDTKPFAYLYASLHQFGLIHRKAELELEQLRANLFNETVTLPISASSNVKGIVGSGALIETLLMPNECSQILIKTMPVDLFEIQIHIMRCMNGVTKIFVKDSKLEVIVNFSDANLCSEVLKRNPATVYKKFQNFSLYNENNFSQCLSSLTVKVTRMRRSVKGFGFIKFKNDRNLESFLHSYPILHVQHNDWSCVISVQRNKKGGPQAYIRGLAPWNTEALIYRSFENNFSRKNVEQINVIRNAFPTDDESDEQYDSFQSYLIGMLPSQRMETLNILTPKPKDNLLIAYVKVESVAEANKLIRIINTHSGMTSLHTEAKLELKLRYFTPQIIYNKMKQRVEQVIAKMEVELNENIIHEVKPRTDAKKNTLTTIEAESLYGLGRIKSQLDPLLSGSQWITSHYKRFCSQKFRQRITKIANNNGMFVTFDDRKQCLVIYGNVEHIGRMKSETEGLLDGEVSEGKKEINLRNSTYSRGLMKDLIRRFGYDLSMLKHETGASDLDINLKKHQVIFYGSQEAYDKLESMVKDVSNEINREINNDGNGNNDYCDVQRADDDLGECPICLDSISFSDHYVTEYCGHIYCKDCITNLIKNNCQQSNFPIKCIKEQCNSELVLKDLQNLIPAEDDFENIVQASVKHFQSQNSEKYLYCPTSDCSTIFKKFPEPSSSLELKEFVCSECRRSVCTSCGGDFHIGMNCATYNLHYNKVDDTLKIWLNEERKNRSICPKCGSGIEKNGGCNHVECLNCKIHICWVCKVTFETSEACYQHMRTKHGQIYDDRNENFAL